MPASTAHPEGTVPKGTAPNKGHAPHDSTVKVLVRGVAGVYRSSAQPSDPARVTALRPERNRVVFYRRGVTKMAHGWGQM